ncbi:hypothetical protein GZ22_00270 [Terribacillus saccharophilus]|uniref:PepSY domain-containing protein n=1 Tax=Terribacillus saccharophilus TaxID=361277 RepID=A0A075LF18_9BACI|nr:hypothetical protein [Terribacillus goriensis]AIF65240.1 hypothetical protein GZ22_00270 [Terribacillus goriensis]
MNSDQNKYDDVTTSKVKDTAKNFIENNYEGIESIELEEPYTAPMGSLTVDGTVNGKTGFSISFDENLEVTSIAEDEDFPEEKEECKEQFCE